MPASHTRRFATHGWNPCGDLLDLHAALGGEQEQRLLGPAIECDREVVLGGDVGGGLDPQPADDVPLDVQAQDVAGLLPGVVLVGRELHAAGLAATARQHLGLHDDRAAELGSRGPGLVGRRGHAAVRDGDAEAGEELLALVLVEIQETTFRGFERRGLPAPRWSIGAL
jgi:hypothetical protein